MRKRIPFLCWLGLHWWKEAYRWVGQLGKEQAVTKFCSRCGDRKVVTEKF